MDCKNCGSPMYKRNTKRSNQATVVYICQKCGTTLYIWNDEEYKWDPDQKTS